MFSVIVYAVNAVCPIMLLIALGYFLRRAGFLTEDFLKQGNKLLFHVVLPALVFISIYDATDIDDLRWDLVLFSLGAVLFLFFVGLVIALLFVKDRKSKGVIQQCIFRSNFAIIGIPLTKALGGDAALCIASTILAFVVPLFNVLAVIALSVFSDDGSGKRSVKDILLTILKNPLILAAVSGILCLVIRSLIPLNAAREPMFSIKTNLKFLYDAIAILGDASNALALIVLGGLLDFSTVRDKLGLIVLGTAGRTVLAPAIGLSAAILLSRAGILSLGCAEYAALIALFGSPVAVSSAIMAAEMHSDGDLARQLVVWTSISPIVTLFAIVVLFRSLGLL